MKYNKINNYVPHTHTQKFSNKLIILFLSLFSVPLNAQAPVSNCTVNGVPDLAYFDLNTPYDQNEYTVKVYFRIFRKDDGTGGYDQSKLPLVQSTLNGAFNQHGIYFDFVCTEEFIEDPSGQPNMSLFVDDFTLAKLAYDGAAPISMMYPQIEEDWCDFISQAPIINDGINIFIGDNLGISAFTTKARTKLIPSNVIALFTDIAAESSTIVHEMGHALGLLHTATGSLQNHFIWTSNECNANALPCFACPDIVYSNYDCSSASYTTASYCAEHSMNGSIAGDYIPDTPPSNQYIEAGHGELNCQLITGPIYNPALFPSEQIELVDGLGNPLNPPFDNYMSTTIHTCRNNFTDNQVHVMKNHLELCPVLTPVLSPDPAKGRCVCPYDVEQIFLDDLVNWSQVIAEYQLDPQELNQVELVVDKELIIDVDYTFNDVKFNFSENASMTIDNFSKVLIKDNSVLTTCGDMWEGVQVLGGSSLETFEVFIEKAHTSIKAENFSAIKIWHTDIVQHPLGFAGIELNDIVNVDLISSVNISNGFYGIYADGYFAQLPIFDGSITVDGIGIRIIQTPSSFSSIVDVTINAYSGISINGGTGNMMVWNNISYKQLGHGIFTNGSNGVFISRNDIGYQDIYGLTGIRVISSTGAAIVENPSIKAYCTGVIAENFVGTINNNPFIKVDGLCDQNGGGIALSNSVGVSNAESEINGNSLYVNNSIFGISAQASEYYSIKNNEINIEGSSSLRGVEVLGSDYINVEENVIVGTENEVGVYVDNSQMGLFKCNDYIDLDLGFHGNENNVKLEIIREDFLSTDVDIEIHGPIGEQDWHGNKFHEDGWCWAVGMSPFEINASKFTYNPSIDKNEPDNPNPTSWFFPNFSNSSVPACNDGDPKNDDEVFSYMRSILQDQRQEDFNVYQTRLFQVLNLNHEIIPNEFLNSFEESNLVSEWSDLLNKSSDKIRVSEFSTMNLIGELQYDFGQIEDQQEQQDIINVLVEKIEQAHEEINSKDQLRRVRISNYLSELAVKETNNIWEQNWKDALALKLNYFQDPDTFESKLQESIQLASLCPKDFGDLVYINRAIVNSNNKNYIAEDCLKGREISKGLENNQHNNFRVVPNPNSGWFTIFYEKPSTHFVSVYNLNGKIIHQFQVDDQTSIDVNLANFKSGLYFIKSLTEKGEIQIKKLYLLNE